MSTPIKKPKRKQNRRAISLRPPAYIRLKSLAESRNASIASVVEELVNKEADSSCVPIYTRDEAIAALGEKRQMDNGAAQPERGHFTW